MSTAKTLRAAADHIERVGLWKGHAFKDQADRENSPCCTIGALDFVTDGDWDTELDAGVALLDFLGVGSIAIWSDSHEKDEVVATLRAAADRAEVAA